MICTKCGLSNDDKYLFCLQCGTALSKKSEIPPTEKFSPDKLPPTEIIPPNDLPTGQKPAGDLPKTVLYMPDELPPTQKVPLDEIPPTVMLSTPPTTTEHKNSSTKSFEAPPTVFIPPSSSPNRPTNPQVSSTKQYVSPESVANKTTIKRDSNDVKTNSQAHQKPKKLGKILGIGGVLLLLLLLGGGVAIYFFAKPMQSDKSYILTNKHEPKENILSFDSQNKTFMLVGTNKDGFQKWQITPDPVDKNYYRFVNRGLGEGESLEVVDDNYDSLVSTARSATDTGQLWAITNVEGDYYRITNQWLGDGKSLSHFKRNYYFLRVKDTSNDDDGQLWKKVDSGDGQSFYLVNKQYGEKLTLEAFSSGEFQDKLAMTAKKTGYSPDNRWIQKDLGNGQISLKTVRYEQSTTNKWLDLNPSKNDRTAMTATASSPGQIWKIIPVGTDGYFRLTNNSLGDGKSLEAVTFAKYNVEMVKSSDEDLGQLWQIIRTDR